MSRDFVDIFSAKNQVLNALQLGVETFSGLLVTTQLPEDVLHTVLRLLEQERKIQTLPYIDQASKPVERMDSQMEEPLYTASLSGWWPFAHK